MNGLTIRQRFNRLLSNSRFWILTVGITISFFVAGFIQLFLPEGSLQTIRIEQTFGFVSFVLLYLAVLASPFTKVFPEFVINRQYLHARRAVGVLSFYYAFLHVYITFFTQLNGFSGLGHFNAQYNLSLLLGFVALCILAVMTMTSLDWAVKTMHFKNWKLLHRLVYIAGVALLIHVALIGSHYANIGITNIVTYILLGFLLALEVIRIRKAIKTPRQPEKMQ